MARSPDRARLADRRSPRVQGDLRSLKVAGSGDPATTGPLIGFLCGLCELCGSILPVQRCLLTPTCLHISSSGHVEHFGNRPVQMCLPNGTNKALISTQ